jgi:hypothetical protein
MTRKLVNKDTAAAPTTRAGRPNHLHRQRIEPTGRNRSRRNSLTRERLYRISRPPPRRVADADSAYTAKNPGSNLKEVERQIPFDAAASVGTAQSAAEKESATSEVNPPPTWGDLVRRRGDFECNGDVTSTSGVGVHEHRA